jgi:hypothetical protein
MRIRPVRRRLQACRERAGRARGAVGVSLGT